MLRKQIRSATALAFALTSLCVLVTIAGCGNKSATTTPSAPLNSKGFPKLTPQQVDEQVKAVEANAALTEDTKASMIKGIRDQGAP